MKGNAFRLFYLSYRPQNSRTIDSESLRIVEGSIIIATNPGDTSLLRIESNSIEYFRTKSYVKFDWTLPDEDMLERRGAIISGMRQTYVKAQTKRVEQMQL